jgi:hypothetical protein
VLQKYLDHQAELELQALYALQALVNSLEHPSGKFNPEITVRLEYDGTAVLK